MSGSNGAIIGAPNLALIDAVVQFNNGTQGVWNNISVPIPKGIVVYASDTTALKMGDGVTLYANLPVLFYLNSIAALSQDLASALASGLSTIFSNVKTYGAVGDGIVDDTVAIQAAANAAVDGVLLFPPGKYKTSSSIKLPLSPITVLGYGATIIPVAWSSFTPRTDGTYPLIYKQAPTLTVSTTTIQGLAFKSADDTSWNGHAIDLLFIQDVTVRDVRNHHISDTVAVIGCKNSLIEGCRTYYAANCAYDHWGGTRNATVRNCYSYGSGCDVNFNGILSSLSDSLTSSGCTIEGNHFEASNVSVFVDPLDVTSMVEKVNIIGNYFLSCVSDAVVVHAGNHVTIRDNTFDSIHIGTLIYVGVAEANTDQSVDVKILDNRMVNCTASSCYILAAGTHNVVSGNIALGCTGTIAINVNSPTTFVGSNDLPGTVYGVINANPWDDTPTSSAMELDSSPTNYTFNLVQSLTAAAIATSGGSYNLAGSDATTATNLVTAKAVFGGGTGGAQLPVVGVGPSAAVQCPLYSEWLVYNHTGAIATIYPGTGATIQGAPSTTIANGAFSRFVPISSTLWVQC